jgi:Ca2+-binding RTX toxin-like protein
MYIDGGSGMDRISGDGGNDTIHGGDSSDIVYGGGGNDRLYGDDGSDIVRGNSGNDIIDGGGGSDIISGNEGNDLLTGGSGHDTFQFASGDGHDTITDFDAARDTIELSGIDKDNITITTQHGSTIIDMGNGNSITLEGRQYSEQDIMGAIDFE